MPKPYTFLSDEEPTDEQLQELMEAALVDVKERAAIANAKFKAMMDQQRKEIFEDFDRKQNQQ